MYALVDTNVFLDYFFRRDNGQSSLFFENCSKYNNKIFISSMSLRDIEYSAHRATHNKELSKKIQLSAYKISQKVLGISADSAIESLYSTLDDYEDSLLVEAAKEASLDCIITRNKKDFQGCGIPVFTPEEINNIWKVSPPTIVE